MVELLTNTTAEYRVIEMTLRAKPATPSIVRIYYLQVHDITDANLSCLLIHLGLSPNARGP